jgi:protein KRI1
MEQSLRKTDDKRKVKRAETKERKQKEKEQKMQELKKLQELKRKEIEEKIQKLKEITGNTDIQFKDDDLESDFDPEAHDKRMQSLFNDEFYEGAEEDQKPEFPELDEYLEIGESFFIIC